MSYGRDKFGFDAKHDLSFEDGCYGCKREPKGEIDCFRCNEGSNYIGKKNIDRSRGKQMKSKPVVFTTCVNCIALVTKALKDFSRKIK